MVKSKKESWINENNVKIVGKKNIQRDKNRLADKLLKKFKHSVKNEKWFNSLGRNLGKIKNPKEVLKCIK